MKAQVTSWFQEYSPEAKTPCPTLRSGLCPFDQQSFSAFFLTPTFPVLVQLQSLLCPHCHRKFVPIPPEHVQVLNIDNRLLVPASMYIVHSDSLVGKQSSSRATLSSSWSHLMSTYKAWKVPEADFDELQSLESLFDKVHLHLSSSSLLLLLISSSPFSSSLFIFLLCALGLVCVPDAV
jgi:hypothetical protein